MTVLEYGDDIIIVDIGVAFPEDDQLGVDLVIPDITYLKGKEERIRGIFITHGHEDHIGAIPFIYPHIPAPIYATRLTLGLIEVKLREHGLMEKADLREVQSGDLVQPGSSAWSSSTSATASPAPAASASIRRRHRYRYGRLQVRPDAGGRPPDRLRRPVRLGERRCALPAVRLRPCRDARLHAVGARGQRDVRPLVAEAPGRVIISTFGSLISRVQQIMDLAYDHGRKVAVAGRSLENNINMAQELGYLQIPPDTLVNIADVRICTTTR